MNDYTTSYIDIDTNGKVEDSQKRIPVAGIVNFNSKDIINASKHIEDYISLDNTTNKFASWLYKDENNQLYLSALDIYNWQTGITDIAQANKKTLALVPCQLHKTNSTIQNVATVEGLNKQLWSLIPDLTKTINLQVDENYSYTGGYLAQSGTNTIREATGGNNLIVQAVRLESDESVSINANQVAILTNAQNSRIVPVVKSTPLSAIINLKSSPSNNSQNFINLYDNRKDYAVSLDFEPQSLFSRETSDTTKPIATNSISYTGQSDPFNLKTNYAFGLLTNYTEGTKFTSPNDDEVVFSYAQIQNFGISPVMDCILNATKSSFNAVDSTVFTSAQPVRERLVKISANTIDYIEHTTNTKLIYKKNCIGDYNTPIRYNLGGQEGFIRVFDFSEYSKFDYDIIVKIQNDFDNSTAIDTDMPVLPIGNFFLRYNNQTNKIEYMKTDATTLPLFIGGSTSYDQTDAIYNGLPAVEFLSQGELLNGSAINLLTKDQVGSRYYTSLQSIFMSPLVQLTDPNIMSETDRTGKADIILN